MTPDGTIVDWTLGELDPAENEVVRRHVQRHAEAALEAADVRTLLEDMRTLTAEPSGRVEVRVRYAIDRRQRLRRGERHGDGSSPLGSVVRAGRTLVRVLAVAAAILGALLLWDREQRDASRAPVAAASDPGLPAWQAPAAPPLREPTPERDREQVARQQQTLDDVLAAGGPSLQRHYLPLRRLAEIDVFTGQMRANNELALLRLEFTQRYSRAKRRQSIEQCGGKPDLEDRIQSLAMSVAVTIEDQIGRDKATVVDVARALRALLAAGSTLRIGHREAVAAAVEFLEQRVGGLEGGELASALAALTDFAVVTGGRAASLVAEHGERLANSVQVLPAGRSAHSSSSFASPAERGRPPLLGFSTPVSQLADAGRVLQLAPAFGVHPIRAHEARLLMAAHLEERLAQSASERPEVLAAMLYGFSDLIERNALDRRLLLWPATLLADQDLVALHHLAWSQFPLRPGWTEFQRQLRAVATLKTPSDVGDAAALLLSLAMNYAAPGVRGVLHLAG